MGKIIPFVRPRTVESSAYREFIELVNEAPTLQTLGLASLALAFTSGSFFPGEYEKAEKALADRVTELEAQEGAGAAAEVCTPCEPDPEPQPVQIDEPGVYCYTPEMGQSKPDCQIEASLSHYGKHYFLYTPLELKGRGIVKEEREPSWEPGSRKALEHWMCYRVTTRAFEKLKTQYPISMERLLD